MDYFDDLNPYLVKEDDNENLTRQQTVPPTQPVEQTYVENILRVNVGKKGTFYFSYTGSKTWNDKIYTGTLQQAGRDHFIIVTDTGKTVMLLLVYLLWAEFDEPLDYQYKGSSNSAVTINPLGVCSMLTITPSRALMRFAFLKHPDIATAGSIM